MRDGFFLHEHPSGMGAIEYGCGILIFANDKDATATRVFIGPAGLRDLAARLSSSVVLIDLGGAK